jgi:hypothetical protein
VGLHRRRRLVLFVVVPLCNLAVPAGSIFHVSDFMVT